MWFPPLCQRVPLNYFQLKPKSVLSKYDEEIEGEKKKSFRLSAGGFVGGERERELQAIRENLRNQAQSLDMPALSLASEYYTPNEMVRIICLSALGFEFDFFLDWCSFFYDMRDTRLALRRPNVKSRESERERKYSRLLTSWWMKLEAQILAPGKALTNLLLKTPLTPQLFQLKTGSGTQVSRSR